MAELHMRYCIGPGETEQTESIALLGGKASALDALNGADLPIPPWFAVTPAAFTDSLTETQRCALEHVAAAEEPDDVALHDTLATLAPTPTVVSELCAMLAILSPDGEPVAVRSSAVDEDGAERSFAGQLESMLFIAPDSVATAVAEVWRSGFTARVLAYRREHGLRPLPSPPAVLIQRMIDADVAGVAFSADPVGSRRGVAVVSAVYGLGTALVSGEADADTYCIDRTGAILSAIAAKTTMSRHAETGDGIAVVPVPAERVDQPALSDEQAQAVAELARRCEQHFGRPQDIEWAISEGTLYLLQSRPITSLAQVADPDGAYNLWDNSNIAESYGGVTTPLTFSFARYVYEQVYRQLCRILGVSEAVIVQRDETFRRMLGLIQGRVYYNLLSWYRLLALAPGFTANRKFMEQMMGVKEGLPESIVAELSAATWSARLGDQIRLVKTLGDLLLSYRRLPRRIEQFYARVDAALSDTAIPLERMRADELAAYYRSLERQLITSWDAPLVNDLFAMMFYGMLRSLAVKWAGDRDGTLQNDLLTGEGGIISAEPAARVRTLAQLAAPDADFVATLCYRPLPVITQAIRAHSAFAEEYQQYLAKFADRCLEELKLESPTLRDDPLPLLRSVGYLAQHLRESGATAEQTAVEAPAPDTTLRRQAEQRVRATLARHPLRRLIFGWILKNARARVRDRENLRFERTRVFGRVRRIFVELGRRFAAVDLLADPRDIFYLEVEEALGVVVGTATTNDLKGLVAVRKAEFARYRALPAPSDRFETHSIVSQGNTFIGKQTQEEDLSGDLRVGLGCCPGIVRGRVRVITDPKGARIEAGEILVAERTDPGWIMLFPAAAGVLVERGSLLSHSAIVARELGIPAIVSLSGVTRWLNDGDEVEMNGATGVVKKIAAPVAKVGAHA